MRSWVTKEKLAYIALDFDNRVDEVIFLNTTMGHSDAEDSMDHSDEEDKEEAK